MLKHFKSLDTISKYLIAAIIIVVPLFPKFPLIRVPGTFVSIRLEDLLLFSSAVLLGLYVLKDRKNFVNSKINTAIFLYLGAGLVSLSAAVFVTRTIVPHIGFLHWARRLEYFIPFFLGYYVIKINPKNLSFYLRILVAVVIYASVYGIGQRYFNWPIVITQNLEYSRGVALRWVEGSHVNSTFAGHYDLATFLVIALPIIVSLFTLLKGKLLKAFLGTAFLTGMWLLVSSASRISLFSYMVSVTLALILIKKVKIIPLVLIISLAFTFFSANLVSRYQRLINVSFGRVKGVMHINYDYLAKSAFAAEDSLIRRPQVSPTPSPVPVFEDRSTNIRFNVEWPRAIRAFAKNPLLGTGYSSITLATDNDYLRLIGELGLLGFFTFSLIIFRIVGKYLQALPLSKIEDKVRKGFLAGMTGALPGLFINAIFIDIFEASKLAIIFWLLTGFSMALINNHRRGK
jgi:hypothetical protein